MPTDDFLSYASDLDIIRHCRENGFPVRSHPFFRDMEKRWPFVLCELKNAVVLGESFMPICDNKLFSDCLNYYGPKHVRNLTQRENSGDRRVFNVDKAFLLGGDRAFGHVVSAFLMRTLYLQLFEHLKDLPVITMAGMPETCYELFRIFGCPKERLILLEENDAIDCGELFVPTIAGGVPPEGDTWSIPAKLTRIYQDFVLKAYGGPDTDAPTEKIYIARKNTTTKLVTNEDSVNEFMQDHGYTIVEPGSISLFEQVRIAQRARYLISAMGSQSHLADFAQPGAQLLMIFSQDVISQRSFDAVLRWQHLGLHMTPLVGPTDEADNLTIDLMNLESAMQDAGFPL